MKKLNWFLCLVTLSVMLSLAMYSGVADSKENTCLADDWTECLERYDTKWGDEDCSQCHSFTDTYKVFLKNICSDSIDVRCCVQETNKTWRCFTWYEIDAGDSVAAYACKGTGKYIWWSRRTGDKSIVFPDNQEVNAKYRD